MFPRPSKYVEGTMAHPMKGLRPALVEGLGFRVLGF